jgi:membrane-associated phospholipid phosphatase
MDLNIENPIDLIGFLAPFLLFGLTTWLLRTQTYYLISYVLFAILNSGLNQVLKLWIKEERPMTMISHRHITDGYGMPSAHAQSSFFSVAFLYLVNRSPKWLIIGCFIGALTLYQRWKYGMHSMEQLAVGSVVGIGFAMLGYQMSYRWIHNIKT